jgi:hypothetical protein
MIRSEPKTILQFLATHFNLLRDLFDNEAKNDLILENQLSNALKEHGSDLETQLLEHKILVPQNDAYIINEPYLVLFKFILQQFKPLLPEEIDKYGQSIRTLFGNIKEGINGDKNILLDRIEALSNEVSKFRNAVTNNTISLLNESRELKANTRKIEYQQKVQKARYWIDNYIVPLNEILNVKHSQSIFNELRNISEFSNAKRFDYAKETIRRQFEKLYNLLRQVVNDIIRQSTILSNELLPLIERIKTESEYLQGFHYYLTNGNCYKDIKPPELLKTSRDNLYNPFIYESTKEYFEQFKNEEEVIIIEEDKKFEQWIFDRSKYKANLDKNLPVNDFFSWCEIFLTKEKEDFSLDNYFMVTSLLFEEDYDIEIEKQTEKVSIKNPKGELILPTLKITGKENVSE